MGNEKQVEGIIAFVGGSASGKTTIAKDTAFFGNFKIVVSTTSRPKRENEKEDIDYFFISQDEFDKKAIAGDFLDPEYFTPIINGELQVHGYGIDKTKYNFTNDIYIVPTDIKRAKKLKQSFGEKVLIIYLTVPQEERLIRARSRSLDFTEEEWNRRLKSEDKPKYHAAAVFASNLAVGLINQAKELLNECGFDDEAALNALKPLAVTNMNNIFDVGTCDALTGPVERHDIKTVQKHLNALDQETKETYSALTKEIIKLAQMRHPDISYADMKHVLEEEK